MRTGKYRLEVYAPGDWMDAAYSIESATPFGAIHEGDIWSSAGVEGFAETNFNAPVAQVRHIFYSVSDSTFAHQICVYLGRECGRALEGMIRAKVGS